MEEIWKSIPDASEYDISNLGRVRRIRGDRFRGYKDNGILTPHKTPAGYIAIWLNRTDSGKGRHHAIHRVLAKVFIPNPQNLPQVNHINGDKCDNRLENLEWITPRGNALHKRKLDGVIRGTLNENKRRLIKELLKEGFSCNGIARLFGVNAGTVAYYKAGL